MKTIFKGLAWLALLAAFAFTFPRPIDAMRRVWSWLAERLKPLLCWRYAGLFICVRRCRKCERFPDDSRLLPDDMARREREKHESNCDHQAEDCH